jgi:hypothetical protein
MYRDDRFGTDSVGNRSSQLEVLAPIYNFNVQLAGEGATVERNGVSVSRREISMFMAEQFRRKAAEDAEAIKNTDVPSEIRKFKQSMESLGQLARNEAWLADNFDKMIRSQDALSEDKVAKKPLDSEAIAKIEEHILRCLGAAVMMQWNTIPRKLQRELFDTAGSLGDVLQTVTLRGQIARFLHSHKDDETPANGISKHGMTKGKPDGA